MDHNALAKQFTTVSLLRFAFPNMVMMVFLSLYTIVDGICVSRFVGSLALSAVNMSYPIDCLEMAVGVMLATGGSAVIARKMGEGKAEQARRDFTCIVMVALGVGVFVMVCGNLFLDPILRLLGTSAAQFPPCRSYTRILLLFAPAFFLQTVFQSLFVTAGKPGLGLGFTVAGGLANAVLDVVLMGPLGLGINGAAIATVAGYCIPAVGGLLYFRRDRGGALWFTKFRFNRRMLAQTCGNGSSEMVSNLATAVTTFLFNLIFLRYWGEDGVAAITIVMYFQFVFCALDLGFAMGAAPVISYKYGAADTDQLKRLFRSCLGFILLCSLVSYALAVGTIRWALGIFTPAGGTVYALVMEGFPLFSLCFLLMGVNIFASSLFTALSNGLASAVISFLRTFVFLVGCLLVLPRLWGETGVWLAVPAAELLGLLVSVGCLIWGRKQYDY